MKKFFLAVVVLVLLLGVIYNFRPLSLDYRAIIKEMVFAQIAREKFQSVECKYCELDWWLSWNKLFKETGAPHDILNKVIAREGWIANYNPYIADFIPIIVDNGDIFFGIGIEDSFPYKLFVIPYEKK